MYILGIHRDRHSRSHIMINTLIEFVVIVFLSILIMGSGCKENKANFALGFGAGTTLVWDAPTTNEDGTDLTDLAGYTVHYGTSSGIYPSHIDVGNVTTYSIASLASGTYFIVVTASNTAGVPSDYSNQVTKVIP